MVERDNIPYLYGKLNQEVKKNTYTGKNTTTASTTVNNSTNEISVDVNLNDYYTKEQVDELIRNALQAYEVNKQ